MRFRAQDWEFVCTERRKGIYDLLIYNPLKKDLYYEEEVDETYINNVDSYGNVYSASKVSNIIFDILFKKLSANLGYCEMFFDDSFNEPMTPDKTEKIPKKTVVKAIRGELSPDELREIVQKPPEKADYYDFDALISGIHRFMRGEVSRRYYLDWVIVAAQAMQSNTLREDSKKQLFYNALSDWLDGHSFDALQENKEAECCEMIARVKQFNHSLTHIRKSTEPPFYNNGRLAVYVCFHYCNHYNSHYKICVADEANKIFKIDSVANPHYLESVNYTFFDDDDFESLAGKYYKFFHDRSIDIHKYIAERPYRDAKGNPI